MANCDNNDSGLTPDDKRKKRLDWAKSAYKDEGDKNDNDDRSNNSVTDNSKVLDTSKALDVSRLNFGNRVGRNYVPDFRTVGKGNIPNAGNATPGNTNTGPGNFNVPDYRYGFPRPGTGEFLGNLDNTDPRKVNFNSVLDTSKVLGVSIKYLTPPRYFQVRCITV